MPKILRIFEGRCYDIVQADDFLDGKLNYVKRCEHCHSIVTAKENEIYETVNPQRQKFMTVKCPNCR